MSAAERAALGAAQERLLAALVGGAEPPPGFDAERVRVQARALRAKHAHAHAAVSAPAPRRLRLFAPRGGRPPKGPARGDGPCDAPA
ncbi:hypothetical protein SAMN05216499_10875 [Actinacidiphila paucisporea]|uniref:SCO6045-like C-terminal domain-containing protein n=1 Tax=Actinacidiphila paucisporea TaxID=310782 RepID=A0A1M7FWB6_9ACTN|nr:hypothetical protein SAMN05216499_10875 [Actinacidiphila paucisporea]